MAFCRRRFPRGRAGAGLTIVWLIGVVGSSQAWSAPIKSVPFHILWRGTVPARGLELNIAVARNGVYVSTDSGLSVFDPHSGRKLGEFRDPYLERLSPPTAVDDDFAVAADSRCVYAVNRGGREVWRYPFGKSALSPEYIASRAPVVTPDRTILAVGADGEVHAIDRTGKGLWHAPVGRYGEGKPAIAVGVMPGLLLLDTRPSHADPPQLVGVELQDGPGRIRFHVPLGIDVSGLVAGGPLGIVATSYVETKSKRGATRVVSLDGQGRRRWTLERGRHEGVRAVTPLGQLVTSSQDAAGTEPGTLIEAWSADGKQAGSFHTDLTVVAVLIGSDAVGYVVGCSGNTTAVQSFGPKLTPAPVVNLGIGCPATATLDDRGTLFLAGGAPPALGHDPRAELVAIQTPSHAAASGWSTPRANARGSAAFTLSLH